MIKFLTIDDVLLILNDQINNYGGIISILDQRLLISALHQPEATFSGIYLHDTIPAMAAAYLYHICQNHPFVDGNKRVALACSLVFLDINGYCFQCDYESLYNKVIDIASGKIKKEDVIVFFENHTKKNNYL